MINITIDGDTVKHENAIRQLGNFLENRDVYVGSLNSAFFATEGVMHAVFSDGQVTMNGRTESYEIDGEKLITTFGGEQATDLFLYTSPDLSLSVPLSDKDLTVISHTTFGGPINFDLTNAWYESDFVGQTYYLVFDDASSMSKTPDPTIIKLVFSASSVQLLEDNESVEAPWEISSGLLKINMFTAGVGDRDIAFSKSISDKNIVLIRDLKKGVAPTLMFTEESLAQTILDKWKGI